MRPEILSEVLSGESERIEWKESDRDTSALLQAVCALANDLEDSRRPGFLVIGVRNDGSVVGTGLVAGIGATETDEAVQRLVNRLTSTRLLPSPSMSVEGASQGGAWLWVIQVDPYPVPPVVAVDGVPWVRKGTSTRRATEADVIRLRERRPERNHPFDLRPIAGASVSDLNLSLLRPAYETARDGNRDPETFPDLESWLAQRDLGRLVASRWTPSSSALLLHGLNPQAFIPGALVEFVRYGGAGFDAPVVSRRTASGTLPDQLDVLWAQLSAHLAEVPAPPNGAVTPYAPEYPLEALRELGRNLVQHRLYEGTNAPGRVEWFDDRIVFSNPGGPFGRASEGEFGTHADYRNPGVTRGLVELGYVERLGRGVRLVRSLLAKGGNPPLEYETDGFTTVTVRRRG